MSTAIQRTLKHTDLKIIYDTREQNPLNLAPMVMVRGTLPTGDYSIVGLTHKISVERKSIQDLVMCVGRERERFDREVRRLLAYPVRAIFIEGSLDDILQKRYRGQVHPNAVLGSVLGWGAAGVPVFFAKDRDQAASMMRGFLFIAARRCWSECLTFIDCMLDSAEPGC